MTDPDPYVGPAVEVPPPARLAGVRPWLASAIVLLLLGSWGVTRLVTDRQDPTLQVPVHTPEPPQLTPVIPSD